MMTDTPLVSIITPIYNGIKYLELCIQNIMSQSYPYIEHIFADGGSADGTLDVLSSFRDRYPGKIKFVSGPDNGVGEALNKGIRLAKGEIFGWLDSDDLYEPDAIMTAVEFFKSNPDAYYVFGGCNIIDETGKLIGEVPIKDFDFNKVVRGNDYFSTCAAFYRREIFESVGYFNQLANNFEFWVRVAQQFKMHHMEKTLINWRLDGESFGFSKDSRKLRMMKQKLREDYLLCRQYGGSIFAPRCIKYFLYVALIKLGIFHFLNRNIRLRMRRYRLVDRMLRIIGA